MTKIVRMHSILILGLVTHQTVIKSMDLEESLQKQKSDSVPAVAASPAKLARLQSLQSIPARAHTEFREQELTRKRKEAKSSQEIVSAHESSKSMALQTQDASSLITDPERSSKEQEIVMSAYERELLEEMEREKLIKEVERQLREGKYAGAPHIDILPEAAEELSSVIKEYELRKKQEELKEQEDFLKDAYSSEECDPTEVQIALYWQKELEKAIKGGNTARTTELLAKNEISLVIADEFGDSPLHWVVDCESLANEEAKISLLQTLLDAGADINALNYEGRSAVHAAALSKQESSALLHFLLTKSQLADSMDMNCKTPLHAAVSKGRVQLVETLLSSNVHTDLKDVNNRTPLQLAFESGLSAKEKRAIVSRLIESGADIDICDEDKTPLLHTLIKKVDVTGVELLLGYGVDFTVSDVRNRTALAFAFEKVTTSSNENTKKILELVQAYCNGTRLPRRRTDRTPQVSPHMSQGMGIYIPKDLQGKIDVSKFRETIQRILTRVDSRTGKSLFQEALEESYCVLPENKEAGSLD